MKFLRSSLSGLFFIQLFFASTSFATITEIMDYCLRLEEIAGPMRNSTVFQRACMAGVQALPSCNQTEIINAVLAGVKTEVKHMETHIGTTLWGITEFAMPYVQNITMSLANINGYLSGIDGYVNGIPVVKVVVYVVAGSLAVTIIGHGMWTLGKWLVGKCLHACGCARGSRSDDERSGLLQHS